VENPLVRWQRRSSCECVRESDDAPAPRISTVSPLPMACFPFVWYHTWEQKGLYNIWGMASSVELSGAICAWTVLGRSGPSICAWTHGLPVSARCLEYPSFHTIKMRFLFLNDGLFQALSSCFTSQASSGGFCTRPLGPSHLPRLQRSQPNNNSLREILCVRVVGWSLATVLLMLAASGGYVLPYLSYVLLVGARFSQDLRKR
jgi:hypothetical protein